MQTISSQCLFDHPIRTCFTPGNFDHDGFAGPMKCFNYYIATCHYMYTQTLVLLNIIPDLYFSNEFTYLIMNMGCLQYQSTLLFMTIVLFMITVFLMIL